MLCCTPASWLSNVIVVGASGGQLDHVGVERDVLRDDRDPAPPPSPPPAPSAASIVPVMSGWTTQRNQQRAGVQGRDLVVDLGDAGDELAREQGLAREVLGREDVDVVLDAGVVVRERDRERLAGRYRELRSGRTRCSVPRASRRPPPPGSSSPPSSPPPASTARATPPVSIAIPVTTPAIAATVEPRTIGRPAATAAAITMPAATMNATTVAEVCVTFSRIRENPNSTPMSTRRITIGNRIGRRSRSRVSGFTWSPSHGPVARPAAGRARPTRRAHARPS